jgi:hypothetical protein
LIISLYLILFCHENPKICEINHSYQKKKKKTPKRRRRKNITKGGGKKEKRKIRYRKRKAKIKNLKKGK